MKIGLALAELSYLQFEAQAWLLAGRWQAARSLLVCLCAEHAHYLWSASRITEAGRYADRALWLTDEQGKLPDRAPLAAIIRARVTAEPGRHAALRQSVALLESWLPRVASPAYAGWILSDMARCVALMGRIESALSLGVQACQVAGQCWSPVELLNRRIAQARLLVRYGRPGEALPLLAEVEEPLGIEVELLRAEALLALGEPASAGRRLQRAYALLDRYAGDHAHVVARTRPQVDALARRL